MKRKYWVIVLFNLVSIFSNAQLLFENTYSNFGEARKVSETSDGGYIISGTSRALGNNDMAMLKLDISGNVEWSHAYGNGAENDYAESVTQTLDGGFLLVGGSDNESFYVKTDANGNEQWHKFYKLNNVRYGTGVVALSDTSYIISGGGAEDRSHAGLTKIDKNGDVVWTKNISTESYTCCSYYPQFYNVIELSNGNILAMGSRFGGSNGSAYLLMITPDGTIVWEKMYTSNMIRFYNGVQLVSGDIVLVGRGSGTTYGTLTKIDLTGNVIWSREYESPVTTSYWPAPQAVAETTTGDLLVVGHSADGKTLLFKANNLGQIIGTKQFDSLYSSGEDNQEEQMSLIPTSDGAFLFAKGNSVKKITDAVNSNCGVSDVSYQNNTLYPSSLNPSLAKNNGVNPVSRTFIDGNINSVKSSICSTVYCQPDLSTDVQSACSSYLWIDGNTYSSSTNTPTWTLTNVQGCDSIVTLNLTIGDNTSPVADVATLLNITSECSVTNLTAPTATDNCAGSITGTHNASLPITTQGTTVVTWTYDDGNGNTSTQTQEVVIDDVTAPVADVATLSDITAECEVTSLTAPTATDNCAGTVTGTHTATLPITASTTITWTYDDGNGNTSTQTQEVIIDDVMSPVADVAILSDITAECEVTSLTAPTATDNCAGAVTGTHNATLPITASTTITWTYDDGNGNTSTQTQEVVIDDVTAPVADVATLSDITAECEVTSLTAPTATDNCAGTVTGTHTATLPITASTTITWTYDDGNGNTSTQTQEVVIDDVTAPVADVTTLSQVTAECEVTSLTAPTATDNCAGAITGTHTATLPITASTTITWTYDDGNGNTSTQTQEVIIDDVMSPVADVATLSDITAECEVTSLTAPTATDNCVGAITGIHNAILPITTSTTITWTYDDGNGNTSVQTQEVVITPIDNTVTQEDALTLIANASGYSYQWLDCNNGNTPINGATNQTFVATDNGSYAVEIDNGTCTVVSDCIQVTSVGIDDNVFNTIRVYPNPANGQVTISSESEFTKVIVVDALGKKVEEKNLDAVRLYTVELPEESGIYFVSVEVKGNVYTTRVVKM